MTTPDPRHHVSDHGPWEPDPSLEPEQDAALRLAGDFEIDDEEWARVHRRPVATDSDIERWGKQYDSGQKIFRGEQVPALIARIESLRHENTAYATRIANDAMRLDALRAELAAAKAWSRTWKASAKDFRNFNDGSYRAWQAAESALALSQEREKRLRAAMGMLVSV